MEGLIFPTPDVEGETPRRMSPRVPRSDRSPHTGAAERAHPLTPARQTHRTRVDPAHDGAARRPGNAGLAGGTSSRGIDARGCARSLALNVQFGGIAGPPGPVDPYNEIAYRPPARTSRPEARVPVRCHRPRT